MSDIEHDAERILQQLAQAKDPHDLDKLDGPFHRKLSSLEGEKAAPKEMLERLRLFWEMLKTPDEVVSFKSKALIMGAVSYFASPLDLIPDSLGVAGYFDDKMVVNIVFNRLHDEITAFKTHRS